MRRWMLFFAVVVFVGSLAGCKCRSFSHGVCDCEIDNHCHTRAPWTRNAPPMTGEIIAAPSKMPEGKKKDL